MMLYDRIVARAAFRLLQSVHASTCDKNLVKVAENLRNQLASRANPLSARPFFSYHKNAAFVAEFEWR
jgi:hypothetical protein